MIQTISVTDLKQNLADVIDQLRSSQESRLILQRSEVVGVLVDFKKYQQLEALVEKWEDAEDIQSLEARKDEPTVSLDTVAKELGYDVT